MYSLMVLKYERFLEKHISRELGISAVAGCEGSSSLGTLYNITTVIS